MWEHTTFPCVKSECMVFNLRCLIRCRWKQRQCRRIRLWRRGRWRGWGGAHVWSPWRVYLRDGSTRERRARLASQCVHGFGHLVGGEARGAQPARRARRAAGRHAANRERATRPAAVARRPTTWHTVSRARRFRALHLRSARSAPRHAACPQPPRQPRVGAARPRRGPQLPPHRGRWRWAHHHPRACFTVRAAVTAHTQETDARRCHHHHRYITAARFSCKEWQVSPIISKIWFLNNYLNACKQMSRRIN